MIRDTFRFCIIFMLAIVLYIIGWKYVSTPTIETVSVSSVSRNGLSHNKMVRSKKSKSKPTSSNSTISLNTVSDDTVSDDNIYSDLKLGTISSDVILDPSKVVPENAKVYSVSGNDYKPGNYWFVCKPGKRGDIVVYSENHLFKLTIDGVHNYTDTQVILDETSFYYIATDFDVKLKTSISEVGKQPNFVSY